MAFKSLPKPQHKGRTKRVVPGVCVTNDITLICVPKDILKQANLLGIAATRVNILIGEGDDTGSFALVAGSDYSVAPYGSKNLMKLSTRQLGAGSFKIADCTFEVGNGHLVVTPPQELSVDQDPGRRLAA